MIRDSPPPNNLVPALNEEAGFLHVYMLQGIVNVTLGIADAKYDIQNMNPLHLQHSVTL